jgi:undecaprenyl pyrophosphate phosphatase UppP
MNIIIYYNGLLNPYNKGGFQMKQKSKEFIRDIVISALLAFLSGVVIKLFVRINWKEAVIIMLGGIAVLTITDLIRKKQQHAS